MPFRRYYDDAMMQAEAQGWADAFNKRRPPKEVQFLTGPIPSICAMSRTPASQAHRISSSLSLPAFVCELIDRPGKPICNIEKCTPHLFLFRTNVF
jgi:hypothetical protein